MKKNKYIPAEKLDVMVEEILSRNNISLEWSQDFCGIDIDEIIEFDYDLEFDMVDLTTKTNNTNVLAAISAEHRKIYLNEEKIETFKKNEGYLRFTKAHELGHWVLHIDKTSLDLENDLFGMNDISYMCRSDDKDMRESQADMFAARILMPKHFFTEAFRAVENKHGTFTWKQAYYLKNKFNVTISALVNRLNELDLCYIPNEEKTTIYRSRAEYYGQCSLF